MRQRIWGYNRVCKSGQPCAVPFCLFVSMKDKHTSSAMFCSQHWVWIDKGLRNMWKKERTARQFEYLTHKMIGQAIDGSLIDHRIKVGVPT